MAKFKLTPEPTFTAIVQIPVHGGGEHPVVFTFRHRRRSVMAEFVESLSGKSQVNAIEAMATAWDLDDAFTAENIEDLLDNFAGAYDRIQTVYFREMAQARAGN